MAERAEATTGRRRPPGPPAWRLPANVRALSTDLVGFLDTALDRYGEIFHVPVANRHFNLVASPEYARHVLITNAANYKKGWIHEKLKPLIGDGIFTSNGEVWRKQRRTMQPQFRRDVVRTLVATMIDTIGAAIERWRPIAERGQIVDFFPEMSRMTVDVVSRALFSEEIDRHTTAMGAALTTALEHTHDRLFTLVDLTDIVPTRKHRRYHEALATLRGIVTGIIRQRCASGEQKPDLLQLLLDARDPDTGAAMDDLELRDQVMTILLAGHETTASALAWSWYLLATDPAVNGKLRAEIAATVGERRPTVEDLSTLAYPRQVFEEALRLYPPVHAFPRDALADDVIGGYRIPAGNTVTICTYLIHRNPRLWEHPAEFNPDRFAPGRPPRDQFAYLPFGIGGRKCMGSDFAVFEATLAITMISQAFRVELVDPLAVKPLPQITFRPNAVPVRLVPAGASKDAKRP
jgi:cytochrome P450